MYKEKNRSSGNRRFAAGLFAAACAAALAVTGCGPAASASPSQKSVLTATVAEAQEVSAGTAAGAVRGDTVTVSSKGSVYAVPDRAELRFGIRTQAEAATQAQQENSTKVDAVVKVLKENGIEEKDIQTAMYDVSPQYDWNTGNGDQIIGYSVYTTLVVRNTAIEDAGKLITACTGAGANEFNGVSYSCTKYDDLYGEALQNAVAAARGKAEKLAAAAGRTLGEVAVLTEGYQDMTFANDSDKVYAAESAMDAGAGAAEESANLMPGEAEITATVTVTYQLR